MSDRSERCCFVHIGAPKTGSSALQRFFFENRSILADRGLLYPDVSLRGYGHHDFAFLLAGGYPDWAVPQPRTLHELIDELKAAITNYNGNVLLSSENFYLLRVAHSLRDMLAEAGLSNGRRVVIVVYVRRQDDAHESWYNQTVKAQGETHTFAECVERWRDLWDYRARLAEWADAFGEKNVSVHVYENRRGSGRELIEDCVALASVDTKSLAFPDPANTRLIRDILEFQRLLNHLPLSPQNKRSRFRKLMELSARVANTGLLDDTPVLTEQQRQEILGGYVDGNAAVARTYLKRDTLFENVREVDESPPRPWPGLTPEKVAYIQGWLMLSDGVRT